MGTPRPTPGWRVEEEYPGVQSPVIVSVRAMPIGDWWVSCERRQRTGVTMYDHTERLRGLSDSCSPVEFDAVLRCRRVSASEVSDFTRRRVGRYA